MSDEKKTPEEDVPQEVLEAFEQFLKDAIGPELLKGGVVLAVMSRGPKVPGMRPKPMFDPSLN